jgi:Mobilization protein NikA
MARPHRKEGVTERIYIRTTDHEKTEIEVLAGKAGLTISEYLRRAGLHRRIHSKIDDKALGELARCGGLQKLCLKELKEIPDSQDIRAKLNETLNAALRTIEAIAGAEE